MVTYDVGAGLSVHNTFLLDQQSFFGDDDDTNYDPNAGDLSIQISSSPMQGNIQIVNGFDFIYTPGSNLNGATSATVSWQLMQDGVSLGGQQVLVFNLPPGGNGGGGGGGPSTSEADAPAVVTPVGTGLANIKFLDWTLSETNSVATLRPTNPDGSGTFGTTLDLGVQVSSYLTGAQQPTGKVIFTATVPNGVPLQIGSANIGTDGKAVIQVDSGILARPGTLVEVEYQGDPFFGITKKDDGVRLSSELRRDVEVSNNPDPSAASEMTVVVVGGHTAAEQLRFAQEARRHYGAAAYLLTTAHHVNDLGNQLSQFPAGSVSLLVFSTHGCAGTAILDNNTENDKMFNAQALTENPTATSKIETALKNGGRLEFQSCETAFSLPGCRSMKSIADQLNVTVYGPDKRISRIDQGWGGSISAGTTTIGWWYATPQAWPDRRSVTLGNP